MSTNVLHLLTNNINIFTPPYNCTGLKNRRYHKLVGGVSSPFTSSFCVGGVDANPLFSVTNSNYKERLQWHVHKIY